MHSQQLCKGDIGGTIWNAISAEQIFTNSQKTKKRALKDSKHGYCLSIEKG